MSNWLVKKDGEILAEFTHRDEAVMYVIEHKISAELIPPKTEFSNLKEKIESLDRYIPKALDCHSAIAAKTSSGYLIRLDEVLELLYE